ncbi:MAG: hypothetical protein J6K89_00790 [Oscillospiraceae bacterium]|nr:hypothetical protein [Oscillospiraceae bacterium]
MSEQVVEVFDSGYFRINVPVGWMAFLGIDSECRTTQKKVHIFKDAKLETDIFTHAGITICFFDRQDYYLSPKFIYDDVVDMEAFTLGAYTWNGYTCTSFGYPYTMLEAKHDGCVFQVMILMKNGEHEISLDDPDVRMILGSLIQTI